MFMFCNCSGRYVLLLTCQLADTLSSVFGQLPMSLTGWHCLFFGAHVHTCVHFADHKRYFPSGEGRTFFIICGYGRHFDEATTYCYDTAWLVQVCMYCCMYMYKRNILVSISLSLLLAVSLLV